MHDPTITDEEIQAVRKYFSGISNPAWFGTLPSKVCAIIERLERAEAERDAMKAVVQDFAEFGCRHDTTPTIGGRIKSPADTMGWYGYVQSMDDSVRNRAKAALEKLPE